MKIYCTPKGAVIDGLGQPLEAPRLFFQDDGRSNVGVDRFDDYVFIKDKAAVRGAPELQFNALPDMGSQLQKKLSDLNLNEPVFAYPIAVPGVSATCIFGRGEIESPDDVFAFTSVSFDHTQVKRFLDDHNAKVAPEQQNTSEHDMEVANKNDPGMSR